MYDAHIRSVIGIGRFYPRIYWLSIVVKKPDQYTSSPMASGKGVNKVYICGLIKMCNVLVVSTL